ncbi:MAG TPA: site-specific integrase [Bryobacteraceae bacterium]|nr:site-specific integrase [Bryobacteraceae bacterium]
MPRKQKIRRRGRKGEGMLFLRGRVWWFKSPNGERESTGTSIESEAIEFKIRKLAELRVDQPHVKSPASKATVNELLDAHLAYMRRKGRKSTQGVEQVLDKHVRPYFGDRVAATLTTADFERYREDKKDQVKPTTINRHLSHLRSGYVTGYRRVTPRLVDFVPAFPIVDESYNVRQGFLSFEGYLKVRDHLPASLRPLFVVAFHVSSRRGELLKIRWSQVDLKDGLIVLSPFDTKNKTGRALPVYGDMVEVLKEQKRIRDEQFPECEHVFFWRAEDVMLSHGGRRTVPGTPIKVFKDAWTKAVKAAGFPNLLFHDLRRTAERNMAKAGMDQTMRMRISGHKTPSMSTRYNIVVAEDVAQEKARMDAWFKSQKSASISVAP